MSVSRRKQHKSRLKDFDVTDFLPSQENGMASAVAALLARSPEVVSEQQPPIADTPADSIPVGVIPVGVSDTQPHQEISEEKADTPLPPIGSTPIGPHSIGFAPLVSTPIGLAPSIGDVLAQLSTAARPPRSRGKYMRATKVEDGHSATQNALYWYLWRQGQHVKGSRSRFVQAGYAVIQAALKIDRSNIQDAVRELQKKYSIRVVRSSTVGSATVYEVFSCDDILAKRRESGMLWVQRFGTRRVDFVPAEAIDLGLFTETPTDFTPIGAEPPGVMAAGPSTGPGLTPIEAVGAAPIEPMGVTPIQVVKGVRSSKTTTTAAALATVVDTLRTEFGQADDQAAQRIIEECRRRATDVTDGEIALQVRLLAKRLRGNTSVENPIGLLITQVPKCFEGESFRQFRLGAGRHKGREEDDIQLPSERQLEEYRAIVEDPSASQAEKRIAQNLLRLGQKAEKM